MGGKEAMRSGKTGFGDAETKLDCAGQRLAQVMRQLSLPGPRSATLLSLHPPRLRFCTPRPPFSLLTTVETQPEHGWPLEGTAEHPGSFGMLTLSRETGDRLTCFYVCSVASVSLKGPRAPGADEKLHPPLPTRT